MKRLISLWIFMIFLFLIACDPKLFEPKDDVPAPEVSKIYTSLASSQIFAGDSAEFWVEASNPGEGSLTYKWNVTEGYFLSPWDSAKVLWRAPFQGGTARVEIKVSNSEKTTQVSKDIVVVSLDTPVVNVLSPINGDYLVQYEEVDIEVEAFHDNGISLVEFYVNDESIGILNTMENNIYKISWLNEAPAGTAEIKAAAVAKISGTVGVDSIMVNIEGVIPGKNND